MTRAAPARPPRPRRPEQATQRASKVPGDRPPAARSWRRCRRRGPAICPAGRNAPLRRPWRRRARARRGVRPGETRPRRDGARGGRSAWRPRHKLRSNPSCGSNGSITICSARIDPSRRSLRSWACGTSSLVPTLVIDRNRRRHLPIRLGRRPAAPSGTPRPRSSSPGRDGGAAQGHADITLVR